MNRINIYDEAKRCLLCADAPCSKACRTGDPARGIRAIRFDNAELASRCIMGQTEEQWIELAKMAERATLAAP